MPRPSAKKVPLREYLTQVAASIRAFGWRPAQGNDWQRAISTAVNAWEAVVKGPGVYERWAPRGGFRDAYERPSLADAVLAEEALEWAKTLRQDTAYGSRLNRVISAGSVRRSDAPTAASLIRSFGIWRSSGITPADLERKAMQDAASQHFGKVGQRASFDLTVDRKIPLEGGDTFLVLARDAVGNVAKFFCHEKIGGSLSEGQHARLAATVKAHEEYRGTKQTVLIEVAPARRKV